MTSAHVALGILISLYIMLRTIFKSLHPAFFLVSIRCTRFLVYRKSLSRLGELLVFHGHR